MATYRPNNKNIQKSYAPSVSSRNSATKEEQNKWIENKNSSTNPKIIQAWKNKILRSKGQISKFNQMFNNEKIKSEEPIINSYIKLFGQEIIEGIDAVSRNHFDFNKAVFFRIKIDKNEIDSLQHIILDDKPRSDYGEYLEKNLNPDEGPETVFEMCMLINPSELTRNLNNTVNETKTVGGIVQEFWPPSLDTLSCSGQIAQAYYDPNNNSTLINADSSNKKSPGLTNKHLRDSRGYKNLTRLIDIFRSNGIFYGTQNQGTIGPNQKVLLHQGYIEMEFEQTTYIGYFSGFNINETADKLYSLDYSFDFTVEGILDNGKSIFVPSFDTESFEAV